MLRLLIIVALVYLLYRVFTRWMLGHSPLSGKTVDHRDAGAIDDVMVKDPQCEVYFPKRKAVQARIDGRDHFFCSTECRDRFLENHGQTDREPNGHGKDGMS
ncbi:MAG: hypothetical protein WAK95_16460 [Desulfobacterales bacterium]